ncbi:MAG TPA: hypothetical protein PKA13_00835 [Geminicoccaceae bacterium]|nr:hypothetical protein [Geminicoccus sp.]HMU48284.1 hypothetical protein [Geminicoccaceae bacterium]
MHAARRPATAPARNNTTGTAFACPQLQWEATMRGILLWLVGIPIPIIILLYLFNVI